MDEKIKDAFEYYNVKSGINKIYGDWAVSNDGDVINCQYMYPIYSYQIKNDDEEWLSHMHEKTWFDQNCEMNFLSAMQRAHELLSK